MIVHRMVRQTYGQIIQILDPVPQSLVSPLRSEQHRLSKPVDLAKTIKILKIYHLLSSL